MRAVLITLALVLGCTSALNVQQARSDAAANPIRKVVTMLQNMQKKVTEEGEKEQAMFDKFMCYCQNSDSTLGASIQSGETKVEQLTSSVQADTAQKAQLEQELKDAQVARVEAKDAMAKATSVREKAAAVYAKESAALKSNIDALSSATAAIEKGMSGAFLQTNTAAVVRQIVINGPSMSDVDRQDMMAFLSGGQGNSYVPQSGQITGILKTLHDEMSQSLATATADENADVQSYDGLMAAKKKEVNALTAAIESKSQRVGELGVKIAMETNDKEDTAEAIVEDKKFLADLATNCKTKKAEWADIVGQRSMELVALADTIKILNDDDALEMFKKTLPGASFIQLEGSASAIRSKALDVIKKARRAVKPVGLALDFVEMALTGKKMGFEKVIKMIDNMVAQLKVEQNDDDHKKEYCELQFDQTDDMKKSLEQKISDLETSIEDAKEGIATTKSELEALEDGIKALDTSVEEATEQRKEEHADYTELMANDSAAKEVLDFAKNRLNKFYNPKLYKAPPKRELEFQQNSAAPGPAPEAPGPFKKKTEESNGVIAMIDLLVKDLDKEMQTAEVDEKDAQKEYEALMGDSAEKRAQDSKLITEKESMKAELQSELEASKEGKISTTKELMGTLEYIAGLHKECDWLLKNFDVRKAAREGEVDALGKAKAVLSGADFSLVQRVSLHARIQKALK
jgi:chromosome segregation ATPase